MKPGLETAIREPNVYSKIAIDFLLNPDQPFLCLVNGKYVGHATAVYHLSAGEMKESGIMEDVGDKWYFEGTYGDKTFNLRLWGPGLGRKLQSRFDAKFPPRQTGNSETVDIPVTDAAKPTVPEGHCELCGQPMPEGEEMFKYHGYSGPCPVRDGER
jgi:hypothetical protein